MLKYFFIENQFSIFNANKFQLLRLSDCDLAYSTLEMSLFSVLKRTRLHKIRVEI